MRISSSIQGMIFAPVLVCLFFVLKALCPESAGESCFADQFAVPIFLPLVAIYKIFGDSSIIGGHEFLLILIYWAFVGFLIGFLIDLFWLKRKEIVIAEPEPIIPITIPTPPAPKPAPIPVQPIPLVKIETPVPKPAPVQSIPIIKFPPPPPPNLPGASVVPAKKPPINLLDRPEFKV